MQIKRKTEPKGFMATKTTDAVGISPRKKAKACPRMMEPVAPSVVGNYSE